IYSEFAPLYDKVFGKIFYNRLERVIEDLDIPAGAKILEVGAGTGTSFPAYPTHCEITGVDLAPDMLARARRKIQDNGWSHFKVLEMDALDLKFPDNTFDYVMAFHVVTVVPDPMTRWLGWRTDLKLKPFIETSHLKVERVYKLNKTSLYPVLIFKKDKKPQRSTREL